MRVLRDGIEYEAWGWDGMSAKTAPRRVRRAICTIAHYGSNWPHIHTLTGFHPLQQGDWILRRAKANPGAGAFLCVSRTEFKAQCVGLVRMDPPYVGADAEYGIPEKREWAARPAFIEVLV